MSKLVSLVLSTYVALVVYTNAFFIKQLTVLDGADKLFWNQLGIFLIIFIPVFLLLNKFISQDGRKGGAGGLRTVLLSIAFLGLLISILYHVIPLAPIYDIPAQADRYFASDTAFTIWLIVPLLALFI